MPRPFVPARRARRRPDRAMLLLPLVLLLGQAPGLAASAPEASGAQAMVVTKEEQATRTALSLLRSGGNAVDAAVAAAFVLSVTDPFAGSLGGGGFLLYRDPEGRHAALDFREVAPRGLLPEMFLDEEGRPIPERSLRGGLAVGVPGNVAGLAEAHRRWGSRPWADLLTPAIRLAESGFPVSPWLARAFAERGQHLMQDEEARAIFSRDGRLPLAGERLVQNALAASLRRIAARGGEEFYRGLTANALVDGVRARGGLLDAEDLADYRPLVREPLVGSYRGYRIVTFPPPSSGGIALLQILGMLERFDLRAAGPGSSETIHLLVEAERRAFADRARWLGDPGFVEVPERQLLDPAYLAPRAASIDRDRATPSASLLAGELDLDEPDETLHLSVADSRGRAVSLSLTLNEGFGAGLVAPGTGILLNNQLDDFALAPGAPNLYGLVGGEANSLRAGKRPLSSMTPTIVEFPGGGTRPALVLGGPGGPAIITSVLQVLINVIDFEMSLQEAVDWPRHHHQWQPDAIRRERRAFPADVERALLARGHVLDARLDPLGNVNAIGVDAEGHWLGAADPRREGRAEGF